MRTRRCQQGRDFSSRTLLWVTLAAALSLPAAAQGDSKERDAEERLNAIFAELAEAQSRYYKVLDACSTESEKQRLRETSFPRPDAYADRVALVLHESKGSLAAGRAAAWLLRHGGTTDHFRLALEEAERHVDRLDLQEGILADLRYQRRPEARDYLRLVAASSGVPLLRVQALRALAVLSASMVERQRHLELGGPAGTLARTPSTRLPDDSARETTEELRMATLQLFEEAEKAALEMGPDFRVLQGEIALEDFDFRHLALGEKSPSILGTDLSGANLSLARYEGKVVLLKFWGFW